MSMMLRIKEATGFKQNYVLQSLMKTTKQKTL